MATKKKMLQAAAGSAGGGGLDITDVFSTYLYTGTNSSRTITNGIDLAEEDGLVWLKKRSASDSHYLMNVIGSTPYFLNSNSTDGESSLPSSFFSLTNSGFNLNVFNDSGADYTSWSFRNAPKFFQKIRYTGNGQNRQISHDLKTAVGSIFVKLTNNGGSWMVWHRGLSDTTKGFLHLNETAPEGGPDNDAWASTAPTNTQFSVGNNPFTNRSGEEYVAFLFSHNDGDGEFGPDADQDIIKCGSYTGNGSTNGPEIDLGFEPQWVMVKASSSSGDWHIFDSMRGIVSGGNDPLLEANSSDAELSVFPAMSLLPTGFKLTYNSARTNASNVTYIYMAIRRGPLNPPTAATEVFAIDEGDSTLTNGHEYDSSFAVDMAIRGNKPGSIYYPANSARLIQGKQLITSSTNSESSVSSESFSFMDGHYTGTQDSGIVSWMWKRAPSYFDVVAYTGSGVAGRTVSHNLGVAPEMMWVKRRNSTGHWYVYHTGMTGGSDALHSTARLNLDEAGFNTQSWKNYDFTTAHFSLDNAADINGSGGTYIAYLFATLAGISKVGSVTHSGTTNVDCGFSAGSRFVMLKRTDSTGDWYIWDSVRGIIAGNDPYLLLNTTAAQVTNTDYIDPLSSGFTITSNFTAGDYIFYAIA